MQGALELLQEHSDEMSIEQRNRFINNLLLDAPVFNFRFFLTY